MTDKADALDFDRLAEVLGRPDRNDREIAIVSLAYIEDYLGRLLRARMPGLTSELRERLYSSSGVLSPLSARIDVAKALDVIDAKERSDLIVLTRVRNRFAHNLHIDSFNHPDIAELLKRLNFVNELMASSGRFEGAPQPPDPFTARFGQNSRGRFTLATLTIATNLHNRVNSLSGRAP